MRQTRTEEYTETRYRQIDQFVCEVCGTTTDVAARERPEGWVTIFHQYEGQNHTMDLCSWACTYGLIQDNGEEGPNSLLAKLLRSVAQVQRERAQV